MLLCSFCRNLAYLCRFL